MAQFMVTAIYTDSAFAGMSNNPHNREEAISKILSTLDMSLETLHMTLDGKLFMLVSGYRRGDWCSNDCGRCVWLCH